MARRIVLSDDTDETQEATVTEIVGFRGFFYRIDLTDGHAAEMAADFEKWLGSAHERVRWLKANQPKFTSPAIPDVTNVNGNDSTPKKRATRRVRLTPEERAEARVWGRANGWDVKDRGLLPDALAKAWRKANRTKAKS